MNVGLGNLNASLSVTIILEVIFHDTTFVAKVTPVSVLYASKSILIYLSPCFASISFKMGMNI